MFCAGLDLMEDPLKSTEAHDFNNFLTGIIGNLSLAKLDIQPGHPLVQPLDEMEKAALRAKELTQQLLTFSKGGRPIRKPNKFCVLLQAAYLQTPK